ncbi:MAG: hypothetical protein KF797_12655 [Flavobacteriales bacterium]|nr:hypothetical protein [Flavobacteriales bacterium]
MATFLKRLTLFMVLPFTILIVTLYSADGRTDPFYLRFTTPRQASMVLGTSRAAQGIQPQVLDSILNAGGHAVRSFNYGFAIGYSNYGKAYYESIRKKLDPDARNGVFVLAVDPWSIAGDKKTIRSGKEEVDGTFIATLACVHMDPNVEYLLKEYDKPLLNIILPDPRKEDDRLTLHKDGWLETDLDLSAQAVAERTSRKVDEYRNTRLKNMLPSAWRLGYLGMTIDLLKEHGTVLLVRLPIHSSILRIEDEMMPGFDGVMQRLAQEKNVRYLKIPADDKAWTFTDGNHLAPADGARVTRLIGQELLKNGL